MSNNSLTRRTTLTFIPLVVGILLRHYYRKLVKAKGKRWAEVPLRSEELMYDEVFSITRNLMDTATSHSVEEMQKFAKLRMPPPPSAHVVRVSVPLSCCANAARVLIGVFGGEQEAKRVLGGVRWWQVRAGGEGIDAEWIMEKKDWRQSMQREGAAATTPPTSGNMNGGGASSDMDEMRCLLWAHGGGYYFGSVDQERYMIQRYARKIRGQVFAPNYRLAPQYPFPCALQDLLASYLFLIQPPEGAAHRPVKPSNIVIGGDSAGGGLALALLQVIRDANLPRPAGAVLVSPWCDLHHSFPSIFLNTDTDVVPATGLTLFKPSPLWPPPPDDMYLKVHDLLRGSVRDVIQPQPLSEAEAPATSADQPDIQPRFELEPATASSLDQTVRGKDEEGNHVEIKRQIQLYTTNALLKHPLVSPVMAYLGGLPPLFVIASDREVLRDEIIYTAHRAANPAEYPVSEGVKKLYPALAGVESRMVPTAVHLQVYDDAAHVLPLAFMTTTPAKYCYRAIATFIKHVTNMPPTAAWQRHKEAPAPGPSKPEETVTSPVAFSPPRGDKPGAPSQAEGRSSSRPEGVSSRATSSFRRRGYSLFSKSPRRNPDLGNTEDNTLAGDPIAYQQGRWAKSSEHQGMIRERVSIHGAIRPLEAEPDLTALQIRPELIGSVSERWIYRYIAATEKHEKKFATRIKHVAKHRERTIANSNANNNTQSHSSGKGVGVGVEVGIEEKAAVSSSSSSPLGSGWSLAWALEADERPPPSSLAARRDIAEALALTLHRGEKRCHCRRRRRRLRSVEKEKEKKQGTFWKRRGSRRRDGVPSQAAAATGAA